MKKLGFILFSLFAATFFFFSCTRTFNIEINDIANIALFDYILRHVFKEVTLVQHLSDGTDHSKDIDLIIEPTVHSYTNPNPTVDGTYYIHIIYEIKFYLPEGKQISSWRIKGTGHIRPMFKYITTVVVELTQMAMREVAAKFITDFCNQVDIKKLFYTQCNQ